MAPAVWFAYTPDRKGEHPQQHLRDFTGILQADGYAGFSKLYEVAGNSKRRAGRTCGANFSICTTAQLADGGGGTR